MHDLSCKLYKRFTKKKFEREARERNEANTNASVTLLAGKRAASCGCAMRIIEYI